MLIFFTTNSTKFYQRCVCLPAVNICLLHPAEQWVIGGRRGYSPLPPQNLAPTTWAHFTNTDYCLFEGGSFSILLLFDDPILIIVQHRDSGWLWEWTLPYCSTTKIQSRVSQHQGKIMFCQGRGRIIPDQQGPRGSRFQILVFFVFCFWWKGE